MSKVMMEVLSEAGQECHTWVVNQVGSSVSLLITRKRVSWEGTAINQNLLLNFFQSCKQIKLRHTCSSNPCCLSILLYLYSEMQPKFASAVRLGNALIAELKLRYA